MNRQVVVTGIGLATPLGDDFGAFATRLFEGDGPFVRLDTAHARPIVAARAAPHLIAPPEDERVATDPSVRLALHAGLQALRQSGWDRADEAWRATGVYAGSGSGPTENVEVSHAALHRSGRLPGLTLLRCLPSGAAAALAIEFGLAGPNLSLNSACASSTLAIGEALRAIRHGYLERALVGGTESPFGAGTIKAWEAMRVLAPPEDDPTRCCRPFDQRRRGIVLGEGAVFFVIESEAGARARGAPVLARLLGYGAAGDARHWTEPDVQGQVNAMRAAIDDAGLRPNEIGAINAHGTGTPVGDRVEADSIRAVFRDRVPPVSATKSVHGHLLGGSGAIELAASIATLQRGLAPPTRNLDEPDPACAITVVRGAPSPLSAATVLSNSFAFGGSNACLVIGAP